MLPVIYLKAILAFSEKETQQTRKYLQKIELNLITGVLFKTFVWSLFIAIERICNGTTSV